MHTECLWLFLKVLHHIAMLLLYLVFFGGFLLLSHLSLSSKISLYGCQQTTWHEKGQG